METKKLNLTYQLLNIFISDIICKVCTQTRFHHLQILNKLVRTIVLLRSRNICVACIVYLLDHIGRFDAVRLFLITPNILNIPQRFTITLN
ncbi:hypothetical protein D3C86_1510970 [compost metagenome]